MLARALKVLAVEGTGWSGGVEASSISLARTSTSNRRGAARSGRASVGARLQGPLRCVDLHPPRGPMGRCLVATPSAGPAHSTGQQPGRTQGHQLYLVQPLGDPVRHSRERRIRCPSGRGQALRSRRHRLPEHAVTRSRRPTAPRPNDRQALQLDPPRCRLIAPPCRPRRRADLRIRVDVDHPGFDQLWAAELLGNRRKSSSGVDCPAAR